MTLLLALDQGTTSSRAVAFDTRGGVVATASRPLISHHPRPGHVEQSPAEIWATQREAAAEVLEALGPRARDLAAVGIANQRETAMIWDRRTGEPIGQAIVWQDRRTTAVCEAMVEAGEAEEIRRLTGLRLDPTFSATKIAWLLDAEPGRRARAERGELCVGTVDTWLIRQLTAGSVHATERTNASRTLLFNLEADRWEPSLCERFRVPLGCLPELIASPEPQTAGSGQACEGFGEVKTADRGLESLRGLPIRGVLGDQQAALLGQGCLQPGPAKCTYGTGCFLLANSGPVRPTSRHRLLETTAAGNHFALEGGVFVGGAVMQWLRDGLGLADSTAKVAELAASVPDAGGVVMVPAFSGLGPPHWDARARGSLQGLTAGTTAAHLCRAALDSIAFQVADLVEALSADLASVNGGESDRSEVTELRADGGAAGNDALMQFQADLLQCAVVRPSSLEATALGAAMAAGVGAGIWRSFADASEACQGDADRFEPRMNEATAKSHRARHLDAVRRCQGWSDE